MARMGRPKSENPQNVRLEIRLTQDEAESLQRCTDTLGTTRTDILKRGIKLVDDMLSGRIQRTDGRQFMSRTSEEISDIVREILEEYGSRNGSQAGVAEKINQKYGTELTADDIGGITRQAGYYHTVQRDGRIPVVIRVSDSTGKHLE